MGFFADPGKGYRDRLEIIRDILLATGDDGSKKTHIMYRANLSYHLLTRYLKDILEAGLIEYSEDSSYRITKNGKNFLELYDDYEKKSRKLREGFNDLTNGRKKLEKMLP